MANEEHLKILKQGVEGWNQWRRDNGVEWEDLMEADLRGAKLRGADLIEADLRGAQLRGADLIEADLVRANLSGANLRGADLSRADLREADLREADLVRANLSGAVLSEADLSGANLRGTNLGGADLTLAGFGWSSISVDLSAARGLSLALHRGPSLVSTDTLVRTAESLTKDPSQRGEVESFLRGAGVQDDFLRTFGYRIGKAFDFYSCFISYSHEDKPFARRLYDQLQARGIRCWLDEKRLLPGDDIYEQVDRGIRLWDKVLLCCSEASLKSWWVEREIEKALKKERQLHKQEATKRLALIPLNLDSSLFKWDNGKASVVLERYAADFTGWEQDNEKFEEQFERVVAALRAGEREEAPGGKL